MSKVLTKARLQLLRKIETVRQRIRNETDPHQIHILTRILSAYEGVKKDEDRKK